MAKFGMKVCPKCKHAFKPKYFNRHKCKDLEPPKPKNILCKICNKEFAPSSFYAHDKRCRAKRFWLENSAFFVFFLTIVKHFNTALRRRNINQKKKKARDHLEEIFFGEDISPKDLDIAVAATVQQDEDNVEMRIINTCKESNLPLSELTLIDPIKDVMRDEYANISAREVIFDFLRKKDMLDPLIKKNINRKLKSRDYPTDEEIQEFEALYGKLEKIRRNTGYYQDFDKFSQILNTQFNSPEFFKCPYCDKYLAFIRSHVKVCKQLPLIFDLNKENAIRNFLIRYYKAWEWQDYRVQYYVNYYKQYNLKYFLNTIDAHVENRFTFRRKIEEGKQKLAQMSAPKWNAKDFIKMVSDWVPENDPKINIEEPKTEPKKEIPESEFGQGFESLIRKELGEQEKKELEKKYQMIVDTPDRNPFLDMDKLDEIKDEEMEEEVLNDAEIKSAEDVMSNFDEKPEKENKEEKEEEEPPKESTNKYGTSFDLFAEAIKF